MIIEFYGLPGAGKSTIAAALINLLEAEGRTIRRGVISNSRVVRVFYKTLFASLGLFKRFLEIRVVSSVFRSNGFTRAHFKDVFNIAYLLGYYSCDATGITYIMDQGLIQGLAVAKNLEAISEQKNSKLFKGLDLVIQVQLDPDVSLSRLENRNSRKSRLENLVNKDLYIGDWLQNSVQLDSIIRHLNIGSFRVDSSKSVDGNAIKCQQRIGQI